MGCFEIITCLNLIRSSEKHYNISIPLVFEWVRPSNPLDLHAGAICHLYKGIVALTLAHFLGSNEELLALPQDDPIGCT
jgi:hypothetical protein